MRHSWIKYKSMAGIKHDCLKFDTYYFDTWELFHQPNKTTFNHQLSLLYQLKLEGKKALSYFIFKHLDISMLLDFY